MKDFIKTILGAGITFGLSDREAFVKQVSGLIEEYQQDPEKAEKWAKAIIAYLEQTRDNINMESIIKNSAPASGPDNEKIDELTKAIRELTGELQKRKT